MASMLARASLLRPAVMSASPFSASSSHAQYVSAVYDIEMTVFVLPLKPAALFGRQLERYSS